MLKRKRIFFVMSLNFSSDLFAPRHGVDSVLSYADVVKSNNDIYGVSSFVSSKQRRRVRVIYFDYIEPLDSLNQEVADFEGFFFKKGFRVGAPNSRPGHIKLRSFSKRSRVGWQGSGDVLALTRDKPFDMFSIDVAPGNHNSTSLRFDGIDSQGNVVASVDKVISADAPQTAPLDGHVGISKLKISEFDSSTKQLHPDKNDNGLRIGIANIRFK